MRKEPAQQAFPSVEPRPVSTLDDVDDEDAASPSAPPVDAPPVDAPASSSPGLPTPRRVSVSADDQPDDRPAADARAEARGTVPSPDQPETADAALADAVLGPDDTTTSPGFTDQATDLTGHLARRTPTPAAHPLDRDPWPAFVVASVPPDEPTLVDAAPPTRASGMSVYVGPHMIAAASYIFWWISGLLVYFNERRNRFVRFHAVQSILLTGTLTIFGVLAYVVSNLLFDVSLITRQRVFATLGQGLGLLAFFLILMLWLAPMIAAWSGAYLRLPIIGDYAERFAAIPIEVDASLR